MPPVKIALAVSLLFASAASAQEPSEADKVAALKRAYQINGFSMVGWGSIDLSDWKLSVEIPLADPKNKNEIDALADRVLVPPPVKGNARVKLAHRSIEPDDGIHASAKRSEDVCARHHMHKVYYGDKWRCRK